MGDPKFILRDARDTLIDLLLHPLGTTFPIPDLPVKAENPTVLFNNPTRITISSIQPDVTYQVVDDNRNTYNNGIFSKDNTEVTFETGLLTKEDYTFNVIAVKKYTHLSRHLLQTFTVKIGVNEDLLSYAKQPIFDYNTVATIIVQDAQNGAKYQLKDLNDKILSVEVASEGGDIELVTTDPVKEDITVKVTVVNIKHSTPGTLHQKPVIRVAPDTSLTPVLASKVVDYNGEGVIILNNTQTSVSYQVVFEDVDDDTADKEQLKNTNIGSPVKGTGKSIQLPVASLKEDTEVYIVAKKDPTADAIEAAKNAGIAIEENWKKLPGVTIPVRPDPDKQLSVIEKTVAVGNIATIKVQNTQRGVLYQLRTDPQNVAVGSPGYHHKNYGIGKARIEVEFAIDTFDKDFVDLPTTPLKQTSTFNVLAIKATTKQEALVGKIEVEVK